MADCMIFPDSVEEFMDQYKIRDTEGFYMSKDTELVPIFRMRQWFEHLSPSESSEQSESLEASEPLKIISESQQKSSTTSKGKWLIRFFGAEAKCSKCGKYMTGVYDLDNFDKFCRNCGSEMMSIEVIEDDVETN